MDYVGPVEKYILKNRNGGTKMLAALLDPDSFDARGAARVAKVAEDAGASLILVGGSTVVEQSHLDRVTRDVKRNVTIPVILFPNNVTGITKYADAILFMSMMNSTNHYFMYGAQVLGARIVHRYRLEALPTGYVVIGGQSSASFVGYANPLPSSRPELASVYAMAAWYLGMRFLYLEAGSGSIEPLSPDAVRQARKFYPGVILAGGGIKTERDASALASSGADIVVVGNLMETPNFEEKIKTIAESLKKIKNKIRK